MRAPLGYSLTEVEDAGDADHDSLSCGIPKFLSQQPYRALRVLALGELDLNINTCCEIELH